MDVRHRS